MYSTYALRVILHATEARAMTKESFNCFVATQGNNQITVKTCVNGHSKKTKQRS